MYVCMYMSIVMKLKIHYYYYYYYYNYYMFLHLDKKNMFFKCEELKRNCRAEQGLKA